MSDLLNILRSETNEIHKRLDQHAITNKLLAENAQLSDFTNYLIGFYNVHKYLEPLIYPLAESFLPRIAQNQRLDELKEDLKLFDVILPDNIFFKENELPRIDTSNVMGALYVMEGSRLGGKYILSRLRKSFGDEFHSNFLANESVVNWKDILGVLADISEDKWRAQVDVAKGMFIFVEYALTTVEDRIYEKHSV